ncbi:MAG: GTP cyclohydrolase FolE2 [Pseudomonadota bacterium]
MSAHSNDIEDVQNRADSRNVPINKVGIKDIEYPVRVADRSGDQTTTARFNMYVSLPPDVKGTHMSRFIELLEQHGTVSADSFGELLHAMRERLNAPRGFIEARFSYFVKKTAPASGVESLMNYRVTLSGECDEDNTDITLEVQVPVTSLCPCSKDISEYGAHNQRTHLTIAARTNAPVWLEELIDVAERQASSEVYGVLKRPDEKFVTERAYDNPKFVEDLVRDVAVELQNDSRITAYRIEAENFESIHNHSAYALIQSD